MHQYLQLEILILYSVQLKSCCETSASYQGASANTTKKWTVFDVLKPWSKKPRQNFLTWQKLKRQKS
jgi:hypothetical protein